MTKKKAKWVSPYLGFAGNPLEAVGGTTCSPGEMPWPACTSGNSAAGSGGPYCKDGGGACHFDRHNTYDKYIGTCDNGNYAGNDGAFPCSTGADPRWTCNVGRGPIGISYCSIGHGPHDGTCLNGEGAIIKYCNRGSGVR